MINVKVLDDNVVAKIRENLKCILSQSLFKLITGLKNVGEWRSEDDIS